MNSTSIWSVKKMLAHCVKASGGRCNLTLAMPDGIYSFKDVNIFLAGEDAEGNTQYRLIGDKIEDFVFKEKQVRNACFLRKESF